MHYIHKWQVFACLISNYQSIINCQKNLACVMLCWCIEGNHRVQIEPKTSNQWRLIKIQILCLTNDLTKSVIDFQKPSKMNSTFMHQFFGILVSMGFSTWETPQNQKKTGNKETWKPGNQNVPKDYTKSNDFYTNFPFEVRNHENLETILPFCWWSICFKHL